MMLMSSSCAEGFGLTGGNRDSRDVQILLPESRKIDNNAELRSE